MDIQISQIIFQIINFSIVLFVLNKFLYKPVKNILEQRSQKIESGVKAAEANLKAQAELETTQKKVLTKAQQEAADIISAAKKDAKREAQEIIAEAKRDAAKVLKKERSAAEASLEKERQELQAEVSKLVTLTTEQLLKNYLDKPAQEKILTAQIKDLKTIKLN